VIEGISDFTTLFYIRPNVTRVECHWKQTA